MFTPFLTAAQLANTLQVNERTINLLVTNKQIPHIYTQSNTGHPAALFDPHQVTAWLYKGPIPPMDMNEYIKTLKKQFQEQFPEALNALHKLDKHIQAPKKGFSLVKVPNKQHGFLYYVRYIEKGKLVPSRWNTHTNDLSFAELFAKENRERLLTAYHAKKQQKNDLYTILEAYYKKDSPYLIIDKQRGRAISNMRQRIHYNFITRVFIPFLKEEHITSFDGITPPLIVKLQNGLLAKGNKPYTVNSYLGGVSAVFSHLTMTGVIPSNVFKLMEALEVKQEDCTVRGCYEITAVQGAFNKEWDDPASYLLCLIIYTTGMRNSEIEKIQVKDMIDIGGQHFIGISRSKTKSGVRIIPLHPFVYEKLTAYTAETGKSAEDYLFSMADKANRSPVYRKANADLGKHLGMTEAELEAQHISFYSGRHYWKTLMNAENLGDIEEYFMGHSVSNDIAKRYNHRDKQGIQNILEKARQVFRILDSRLFTDNPQPADLDAAPFKKGSDNAGNFKSAEQEVHETQYTAGYDKL